MIDITKVKTQADVCQTAANDFVTMIHDVNKTGGVHGDGIARVVLTGGGAGIGMLKLLVNANINWELVHIFFGDERNVAVTHPDSNEGQARAALLDHIAIPEANIHGFGLRDGVNMAEAAEAYTTILDDFAPHGFDLHLLGMGGEGHINSLFPHTQAVAETTLRVLPVYDSPKPPPERLTLTLPAVNSAERVWLLVAGAEKAEAAANVPTGNFLDWPAAGAKGRSETRLIVAEDAATLL